MAVPGVLAPASRARSALAIAVWAALATLGRAGCSLRLEGDGGMQFSGASAASMVKGAFPVAPADPETAISLSGPMFLTLPGDAPCPDTEAAWAAAVPRAVITSAPSPYVFRPLRVSPDALRLVVMGLPLNMTGLAVNLTLAGRPTAGGGGFAVSGGVAEGHVFSDTPLTGGPQLQAMAATPAAPTASPAAVSVKRGALNITLPRLNLTFVSETSGSVGGKPWTGSLTFSLAGPLTLTAALGCPGGCGDNGRCVALNASAAGGGAGCECECGWAADAATGRCEVPAGSCPLFGDAAGGRSVSLVNASGAGGCEGGAAGSSAAATAGGACPAAYGFDVFTKTCAKCPSADWAGPGCKMCTTDKACQTKLSKPNGVCSTGLTYNERSAQKFYACSLTDTSIARIIGPVLPLTCTTGGGAGGRKGGNSALAVNDAALLGNQASCTIAMRLAGMPAGQSAMCTATGCHFAAGSPSFRCDGVACDCPDGCPSTYLKTFRGVSGAVTLDCDVMGQDCHIVIGSLNMRIAATCEASECLDPAGPKRVGSATASAAGPPVAPPLIAALPLLALLLGGAACLASLARYSHLLFPHRGRGAAPRRVPCLGRGPAHARSSSGAGGDAGGGGAAAVAAAAFGGSAAARAPHGSRLGAAPGGAAACGSAGSSPKAGAAFSSGGLSNGGGLGGPARGIGSISQLTFVDVTADVRLPLSWRERLARPLAARRGGGAPGSAPGSGGGADVELGGSDAVVGPADAAHGRWRRVLRGVSGAVSSGEVLGVMGPSGGGKSTLLLKLCGSLGGGGGGRRGCAWRSGGLVTLDGVAAPPSLLAAVTALVPQDDTLMRSLTVEECIRYSAALRLDPSLPPGVVSSRVSGVMATLGLTHIAGSTVLSGTGVSGVSGGERRRVAIGMELVIDPQVLVLDEPLSGLDSYTALQLMSTLKAVAASGRGGALSALGVPVPPGITLAEHLLHVVCDPESLAAVVAAAAAAHREAAAAARGGGKPGAGHHARGGSHDGATLDQAPWPAPGARAPSLATQGSGLLVPQGSGLLVPQGSGLLAPQSSGLLATGSLPKPWSLQRGFGATFSPRASASGQARALLGLSPPARPFGRQVAVLFWRGGLDMLRNPLLTAFHSLGGLGLGLLVGVIFYGVQNDTSGAQNRVGALFFALCLLAFTSVTAVDLVQAEATAAGREMGRKYYSPLAYAATKLVLDGLLLRALPALLFGLPFYFLMGLNPAPAQVVTALMVLVGFSGAVGGVALGCAAALDSPGKTILVMNLVLLLGVLFGGFLANKASIPAWLRWASWLSVFRYAWEALAINELSGLDLFLSAPGVSLSLPVRGEVFLQIIGVDAALLPLDIAVLVGLYAAAAGFVVAVVCWRNRQAKH
ncbi:ABCG2 [Scenedesmus sp. PABB004]|nr:ABCG2 [Scenedesmus sp. PABB004]